MEKTVTVSRGIILFIGGLIVALLFGWTVFPSLLYTTTAQPLQFSHRAHTGESVGLACTDCHAFDAAGRFTGIPRLEKCAGCHSATVTDSPDEKVLVDEYVSTNREIPWLVYARQPQNAYFPHLPHVQDAAIACERCHGPHGSSERLRPLETNRISGYSRDIWGKPIGRFARQEWEGMKMDDCAHCHQERGVSTSCIACHK
jgi:cytochrome c553